MKDELQQYLNNMNNNDESVTTIDNIINLNKPD